MLSGASETLKSTPKPPTLADVISNILSRREQTGKSDRYQAIGNLKAAAKMLNFLQQNQIMDIVGLDEKFKSMIGAQMDIRDELKPIERRLPVLKKHIEQAEIYLKYKGKKSLSESEQIRKSVDSILRHEQREQKHYKAKDMEL